jgi:OOP family OmpA-OmpF porin
VYEDVASVYNIGKEFGLTYLTRDRFGVNAHIDAGVAFAYLIGKNEYEQVKVVGIGITPMYNISNKIALTADFTHNFTSDQNYGFDGQLVDPINKKPDSGSFYNFSFGIIFYLGENRYHSDWY